MLVAFYPINTAATSDTNNTDWFLSAMYSPTQCGAFLLTDRGASTYKISWLI
jgi:hypothetical protein